MTVGPDARAIKADLIRTYDASATARDERDEPDWRDDHRRAFATALSPGNVERCVAKGLEAYVADFTHLDFADGWFDAVWAMSCLMHATDEDLTAAIDERARVLAPDGLVTAGMWGGDGTAAVSYTHLRAHET